MMSNTPGIPEISVQETARKLKDGEIFILLDVREAWEIERARLPGKQVIHAPMSQLARQGCLTALRLRSEPSRTYGFHQTPPRGHTAAHNRKREARCSEPVPLPSVRGSLCQGPQRT